MAIKMVVCLSSKYFVYLFYYQSLGIFVNCYATESAPTSPGSRVDAAQQNSSATSEHSISRLTVGYPILPVLSSSAPEREGVWHEVKRKSTERIKVTTPKETTPKQRVEVWSESCLCSFMIWFTTVTRAQIDWPISQESLASPNLVGDRAVHPVCNH